MLEWIEANKTWLFDGIGVTAVVALFGFITFLVRKRLNSPSTPTTQPLEHLKGKTVILFVDDDTRFKVVDILVKSGWSHTRRARDVTKLDDDKVLASHILFVDIHGVGRRLQFKDEGLGLAQAIKKRYPAKKVVIYSAEKSGEQFHHALRMVDETMYKNADPYEFEQVVERLAREVWAK